MLEIKITNGDVIRSYDNEHLTKWVFEISNLIMEQKIEEYDLCKWLGNLDSNNVEQKKEENPKHPEWANLLMQRFNRVE